MKRMPVIASFLLFVALCASLAYWTLQLWKPPVRPMAAPIVVAGNDVQLDAAATLFGGRPAAVGVASNFQLKGVVVAENGRESVAIISADGKPAQAVGLNTEFQPGVSVREVHSQYVLVSEGGVVKRVALPDAPKSSTADFNPMAMPSQPLPPIQPPPIQPPPIQPQIQPTPQMPTQIVQPAIGQMSTQLSIPGQAPVNPQGQPMPGQPSGINPGTQVTPNGMPGPPNGGTGGYSSPPRVEMR